MKIIQSYAHFDEGSPYLREENVNKKILNFYSFLLSYITLKKYYGSVTMYCDKRGCDTLIKYVPYDSVVIVENRNSFKFWSFYKVDIIRMMKEDFIHVDSDVFIFDDLFRPFIDNKKYDIIIQDRIPKEMNYSNDYVNSYKNYLIDNKIFDPLMYDGRCFSCGTIGMRISIKDKYIMVADAIKRGFDEDKIKKIDYVGMICEELALYLAALKFGFKEYEILDHSDMVKYGAAQAGNIKKYTHMYLGSKYNVKYVKLIKNKILKEFPEFTKYIEKYENEIMKGSKLLKELN